MRPNEELFEKVAKLLGKDRNELGNMTLLETIEELVEVIERGIPNSK